MSKSGNSSYAGVVGIVSSIPIEIHYFQDEINTQINILITRIAVAINNFISTFIEELFFIIVLFFAFTMLYNLFVDNKNRKR